MCLLHNKPPQQLESNIPLPTHHLPNLYTYLDEANIKVLGCIATGQVSPDVHVVVLDDPGYHV